jgi:hypothetical protein
VAFKQNLPAAILVLLAAGTGAAVWFLRPGSEDLLLQAAQEYARGLGPVADLRLFGPVADIALADGRVVHAEFAFRDGRWQFSRDLFQELENEIRASEGEILRRLGQRLADRFREPVTVKEGLRYEFSTAREGDLLLGRCLISFRYPSGRSGRYLETFRYVEGRWNSDGPGALYDALPPPRRNP